MLGRAVGDSQRAIGPLVPAALDAGAKMAGLDIVFPEPDQRVPDGVGDLLRGHELGDEIPQFETDPLLKRILDLSTDRVVIG